MSIEKELRKDAYPCTTHRTVTQRTFQLQWTKGGGLQDWRRPGRPTVITEEIAKYLDKMLENDELSASEFHHLIAKKFSVQIPVPAIRRFLRLKLNWSL